VAGFLPGQAFAIPGVCGLDAGELGEGSAVVGCIGLAGGGIGGIMGEFDPEESGLQGIQPEVASDALMVVFWLHAVDAEDTGAFGEGGVVGGEEPGVPEGSKVFTGKEAEAPKVTDAARWFSFAGGSEGLGGVFDNI